jgi:glucose/arabinose dehydrogenase
MAARNGLNGGDEINILLPGRDYGWPQVSFGRDYPADASPSIRPARNRAAAGAWVPATVAGMAVYTGDNGVERQCVRRRLMEGRIPARAPAAHRVQ